MVVVDGREPLAGGEDAGGGEVVVLAGVLGERLAGVDPLGFGEGEAPVDGPEEAGADGEGDGLPDGEPLAPPVGAPVGEASGTAGCAVRRLTPTAAGSVRLFWADRVDLMPYFSCSSRRY